MDNPKWLAGWYATRLHAFEGELPAERLSIQSLCGAYVYEEPRTDWARKRVDAGIPKCKHCERIIAAHES